MRLVVYPTFMGWAGGMNVERRTSKFEGKRAERRDVSAAVRVGTMGSAEATVHP